MPDLVLEDGKGTLEEVGREFGVHSGTYPTRIEANHY